MISRSSLQQGTIQTHPCLSLRNTHDAQIILEAVRLNILPLIRRRLEESDRRKIRAGDVFVWEEADDEGGLQRWTDGRKWSQSKARGDYLLYEEKVETTQEEKDARAARRAIRLARVDDVVPIRSKQNDRPSKPGGLTKQTYSALVYMPGMASTPPKKWHIVAYFSDTRLPDIEHYEYLRAIRVPKGVFFSRKSNTVYEQVPYHEDISVPSNSQNMVSLPPLASFSRPGFNPPKHNIESPTYTPLTDEDRRQLERFRVTL